MKVILGVGTKKDLLLGISRHMILISNKLKSRGIKVKEVFHESKSILPFSSYALNSFFFDLFLLKEKNKHSHAIFPSPSGAVLRSKNTKVITILHEVLHKSFFELLRELKRGRLKLKLIWLRFPFIFIDYFLLIRKEKSNLRKADLVIIANELHRDYIIKKYGISPDKIIYVPNGVDTDFFSPSKGKLDLLKKIKEKKILFMGYFSWKKGAYYLSKALEELGDEKFKLIFAGQNSNENLSKYFRRGFMEKKVLNLGPISVEDQPRLYNSCDMLILHSLSEATPLTLAEALSCEVPVVGSDECDLFALRNGEAGLVVKKRDISGIAKSIKYLLRNPKKSSEMGRKGRLLMKSEFEWGVVVEKINSLLKDYPKK